MKLKSTEQNIWFTSDTHYGHKNIVRGVSEWEDKSGCRDFNTIEKMNAAIVDGINKYVQPGDTLIHLGDWSFGGIDNISKFSRRLNSRNIYLVIGNHDEHIRNNKLVGYVLDLPMYTQELFHSTSDYLEIIIDKKNIVLSHYPIVSWNRSYRGAWMLHGHTHNTLFQDESPPHWYHNSKIMDVGVDSAFELFGEYRPFKFEEIKKIMDKKSFISIDQHDKNTNG